MDAETKTHSPRPKRGLYTLNADGGVIARPGGAAGVGAIGVVLKDSDNEVVEAKSERLDEVPDHHFAEFTALIEGLKLAKEYGVEKIRVFLDSELVVNTVVGEWKLHPQHLRPLLEEAQRLYAGFEDPKLSWVPREMNTEADLLATTALPRKLTRESG